MELVLMVTLLVAGIYSGFMALELIKISKSHAAALRQQDEMRELNRKRDKENFEGFYRNMKR